MTNTDYVKEDNSLLLLLSSLLFISNALTAHFMGYFVYCILFFFLAISSIIYHTNPNSSIKIIDKTFIICIVLYGSYILYRKANENNSYNIMLILMLFFIVVILYYYGNYAGEYCFHNDIYIANTYHSILHLICSIGHHMIVFL